MPPLKSAASRPATPLKSAATRPAPPLKSAATRSALPLKSAAPRSALPLKSAAPRSAPPLKSAAPRSALPLKSATPRSALPLKSAASRPATPLKSAASLPAPPLKSASPRSALPPRSASSRPAPPLRSPASRPTPPLRSAASLPALPPKSSAGRRPLLYTALGDSLTAGVGTAPAYGLVPQYQRLAEGALGRTVDSVNLGVSGATTADVLRLLRSSSRARGLLADSDIITLTAGSNDLIHAAKDYFIRGETDSLQEALVTCREHYAELLREIRRLKVNRSSGYIIRAAGLYNPLPDVPAAVEWVQRLSRHIGSLSGGHFRVAPVYEAFRGREKELLSSDGFHPNAAGYAVMAEGLARVGFQPLQRSRSRALKS